MMYLLLENFAKSSACIISINHLDPECVHCDGFRKKCMYWGRLG